MRCSRCGHENPERAKFCNECGNTLELLCTTCATPNPPGSKFCSECGTPLTRQSGVRSPESGVENSTDSRLQTLDPRLWTPRHLAARILAEQAAMEARGASDGERKTITALFADITGSMNLIEDLDPEEARRIVDPVLQLMMEAVHRYEGYVTQSTGDGIFALFGAPIAHEDHAQRALYAALKMQEESQQYAGKLRLEKGVPLQIRIGVNTGEVVMRSIRKDDLRTDYVPIGHSTSLAARMESLATPGTIVVSEYTYKLTEGYFQYKSLGAAQVKGVSEPINIYEVVGVGLLRTRLQRAARRGLTRLIGRQGEMAQMRQAFALARAGHGQIVGAMGEAGMGKSRLFYEFVTTRLRPDATSQGFLHSLADCLVLETFSVSHSKGSPYVPLIDLLKDYFQLTLEDDERKRREKVGGKVLMLDRSLEDALPYLLFLLGIAESTSPLQQMDPQVRKRRTGEAIRRLLVRESLNQPLILIFEDLHWLDQDTQDFLTLLSESVATARILLLVNYRPEYRHDWGSKTYYTQLRLDPLQQEEAQEFLTTLLGDDTGVQPLRQLILEKTEGNPFFMEEIIQALVEQGVLIRDRVGVSLRPASTVQSVADLQLPSTVQGVLAARIDRLPAGEKVLLQTLAVIGREFSLDLLTQVVDQPEDALPELLSHLQAAEFIYEQPAFPEVEYTFKHAFTQEVAYNSLLLERRKGLHERTAKGIEDVYRLRLEDYYGELAHHYSHSGNTEKAVQYLRLAGQQAVRRSAHAEATGHLTTALGLLKTLPDSAERIQQELKLQIALGAALQATKGPSAAEVERAYTRARELCQQVGDTPLLFPVLRGLWVLHHVRAELGTACELGDQLLHLAERLQDPALLLEAHRALGSTLLWLGEFSLARAHLEQGSVLYDPQQHSSLTFLYGGANPSVSCLCDEARALWFLGYPDQALQRSHTALTLAQGLSDPFSLGYALVFAAGLHQLRREGRATQERAEAAMALANEQGFVSLLSAGEIRRGWALTEQGQAEEGLRQMRHGLTARQTAGAGLAQAYFLALQAEVYGKVGQMEQALPLLAEALAGVKKTGELRWEAELWRLKGELTLSTQAATSI